jgi:hypothetical protein
MHLTVAVFYIRLREAFINSIANIRSRLSITNAFCGTIHTDMIFLSITGNNTIYAWKVANCLFFYLHYSGGILESSNRNLNQGYPLRKQVRLRNPKIS